MIGSSPEHWIDHFANPVHNIINRILRTMLGRLHLQDAVGPYARLKWKQTALDLPVQQLEPLNTSPLEPSQRTLNLRRNQLRVEFRLCLAGLVYLITALSLQQKLKSGYTLVHLGLR